MDRKDVSFVGLFKAVGNPSGNTKISNLGVEITEGKSVRGYSHVGGIAGQTLNTNITNVYSTGNVSGGNYIGSVIGHTIDTNTVNVYSTGNVSGEYAVGGIVGFINRSNITNAYSTANVNGEYAVGGIVGLAVDSKIANSYSTGNVSGGDNVGGIEGHVYVNNFHNISNNVAINDLVNGNYNVNRVAGYTDLGIVSNNFALDSMKGGEAYNGITNSFSNSTDTRYHGIDKTLEQLKMKETYSDAINEDGLGGLGWKFGDDNTAPWKIDEAKNNGYPYFYWQKL
jgi:hypothetical protein